MPLKRIIYILASQNTDEEESKILNEIYRSDETSPQDIDTVLKIFKETNVIKVAEQLAINLVYEAKNLLQEMLLLRPPIVKNNHYLISPVLVIRLNCPYFFVSWGLVGADHCNPL